MRRSAGPWTATADGSEPAAVADRDRDGAHAVVTLAVIQRPAAPADHGELGDERRRIGERPVGVPLELAERGNL